MTDDELSELEECMVDACREAVRNGWEVVFGRTSLNREARLCCPIGAMAIDSRAPSSFFITRVADAIGLDEQIASDFIDGFDWHNGGSPAALMGRRMRERLEAGEFNQC